MNQAASAIEASHTCEVWCVALTREPKVVRLGWTMLAADERERAQAYRLERLRDDFTTARGALRVLLSRKVHALPSEIRFVYGPRGKPALAAETGTSLQFNAARSGGLFVCAVAPELPVGVDIEQHRPMADYPDIARRFFSALEYEELMSVAEADRLGTFFECWARKEAFIKALGGGLSIPLDSFRVSVLPGERAALLDVRGRPEEAAAWTLSALNTERGYSGALAIRHRAASFAVHHTTVRELLVSAQLP